MKWPRLKKTGLPPPESLEKLEQAEALAEAARREAEHRRMATLEVLRLRDDVKRRNHIADDIGRAYRIIHERG